MGSSLCNDVEKYKNESNDYNLTIKKQINEIADLKNQLQIFKNRGISLENEYNYNMCNNICFEMIQEIETSSYIDKINILSIENEKLNKINKKYEIEKNDLNIRINKLTQK